MKLKGFTSAFGHKKHEKKDVTEYIHMIEVGNTEGNSDKIWGYFLRPTEEDMSLPFWKRPSKECGWNCCVFWGRRDEVS